MVSYHKLKFNSYTLQVKKGNHKPIDPNTYIISMQSAFNCCCRNVCKHHRHNNADCYGLGYELNPAFMKNTLNRRFKDEQCIDYLVKTGKAADLANKLIKLSNRSKTYKMDFLRWQETGDVKTLNHLVFVNDTADILYKELGVYTTIYTHQEQIYKTFKANYIQSKGLIIIGSDFMADLMFKAVSNHEELKNYKYICSGNCSTCKHNTNKTGKAYCYDPKLKGKNITIAEPLRPKDQVTVTRDNINKAYIILEAAATAGG